ncbi:tyrosine-type recombinase/integrase [Phytohabitans kaempferiae]|uniref:Tyrosine-type recombinase/integrase n=1 Tax=Phytohabitans kaempferiae TaxID=1620943 RepID=A0ABV6MBE3_9ACTN
MIGEAASDRDLATLVVPQWGRLDDAGDAAEPYRLLDDGNEAIEAVTVYFRELLASGCATTTLRSYGMDLLRWFRFLVAVDACWDRAGRVEARDFMIWLRVADKPKRTHWRRQRDPETARAALSSVASAGGSVLAPGAPNPVTGKPNLGRGYSAATRAHAETVLRAFYDFHLERGTGPIVNPFPLERARRGSRANAHHNPLQPFKAERKGRYRPRVQSRVPRRIPDDLFNALFAVLTSHRDRALLAFWVSTGVRAQELLDARRRDADPGQQLISVVRKGSRVVQRLPASADAFVWLRLYQEQLWRSGVPRDAGSWLWWTLRRPWRRLTYPAARAMFGRANSLLGANWTLHDVRHTAAYRMARDPQLPLTDVQWVLGHASLSTTQIYTVASQEEVIADVLAHHTRRASTPAVPAPAAPGYDPASLNVLFGNLP